MDKYEPNQSKWIIGLLKTELKLLYFIRQTECDINILLNINNELLWDQKV